MPAQSRNFVSGVVIGTGALLNVKGDKCGFKPTKVTVLNITDGSRHEWVETMPDGYVWEDKGGSMAYRTSGGIIPLSDGFSIGTQGNLNAAADELHYSAEG